MIVNFPLATSSWDEREYAAIDRVVRSGMFSMGDEVKAFEQDFAAAMGSRFAIMANSGSSANLLIVAALRYHSQLEFPAGGEVIVPAVSWSTTYYPLHQYGMRLKFVDIDRYTLNYDLEALASAISSQTCAIMAVNLLGNPNDFDNLEKIIAGRPIILLEDNCESLGAVYGGRQAGTFGIAGSYSSFFSHHIATMEGGLVVTDDEELYQIMLSIRAHGWTRNLPQENFITGRKSDNAFEESFRFVLPGYNLRPLELSGAIGREQIRKLPSIVEERRRNAILVRDVVDDFPYVRLQKEIGESSWFGFSMILEPDAPVDRNQLVAALSGAGIESRPIVAGNFAKNPVVTKYMEHVVHGELKGAEEIDDRGLFIGNHHYPLEKELEYLEQALRSVSA